MQKIKSLMTRQGLKSPQESLSDLGAIESLRVPGKAFEYTGCASLDQQFKASPYTSVSAP
ncbi:VPS50 subunit of EARP/GARPII complex [Homo sapiens]|uniref:VPS50 subunit of EARP/GARPII complex n=1 Tax=Homo sapiens TaxID=9606 RepID=A0A3B3IRQ5_HUMAN|nr:VPS50 subunit of EARP/GARPII complex [Homo sapiens]